MSLSFKTLIFGHSYTSHVLIPSLPFLFTSLSSPSQQYKDRMRIHWNQLQMMRQVLQAIPTLQEIWGWQTAHPGCSRYNPSHDNYPLPLPPSPTLPQQPQQTSKPPFHKFNKGPPSLDGPQPSLVGSWHKWDTAGQPSIGTKTWTGGNSDLREGATERLAHLPEACADFTPQ